MNADRLFALYDRVAEAPDAVGRLRRFVLDLAVRGKLVKQDPADEPASELLKRISAEKARLVKAGEIRNPKKIPVIDTNELPFDPPRGWEWTRLLEISRKIHYGYTASANRMIESVRLLRITDIQDNRVDWFSVPGCEIEEKVLPKFKLERGDVLIARTGGTIGKSFLVQDVPVTAVFASYLIRIQGSHEIYDRYLKLFLESPAYWTQLRDGARGAGQPNVNGQILGKITVPLPPLVEQHRIVAKVNELLALCDRLEEARTAREDTRDGLTKASLTRLVAPDIDAPTFRSHARFAVDALPALTARADQVKHLRQAILNLAFRGKLVEQDLQEGSGRDVYARITSARPSSPQSESVLKAIDGMYPLPSNWTWVSLGQAIVVGPRNGLSPRPSAREDAPRAVTLTATTSGIFDGSHFKRVDANIGPDSEYWLQPNDLLFQRGNTPEYVGMAAIYDGPPGAFIFPDLMIRVRLSPEMNLRFAHLFCVSPAARSYFSENATGAQKTMPKINQAILRALPIPLPPLSEQRRIVVKVDELMALCDRIEAGLVATDDSRSRLLESTLHDALTSAGHEPATAGRLEA